jgi:glycosyltransferase involved in cell wall biosynthesis
MEPEQIKRAQEVEARRRISVVIPAHRRPEDLSRALESLCEQTFRDFEVIVADDGSDPPLRETTERFIGRIDIRYLHLPRRGRPAGPRNRAIQESKSEWICFLDSDDTWDPEKLEALLTQLREDVDLVFHPLKLRNQPTLATLAFAPWSWRRRAVGSDFCGRKPIDHFAIVGNTIAMSGTAVRRTSLVNAGGFDEEIERNDDYDMWVRLAAAGARFKFLDRALGTYANGDDRVSTRPRLGILARRRMRLKHKEFFTLALWEQVLARFAYLDAVESMHSNEPEVEATAGQLTLWAYPRYWLALKYRRAVAKALKRR